MIFLTLVSVALGIGLAARDVADTELRDDVISRNRAVAKLVSKNFPEDGNIENLKISTAELKKLSRFSIYLLGPDGKPVNIWRLRTAVPLRWSGPDLDARSGELAFEEVEVTYDKIEWRTSV